MKTTHTYERRRLQVMERKLSKPQRWDVKIATAINILRCAAWYEHVCNYLRRSGNIKCKTPYAIGKLIQPHTYRGAESDFSHNNLWPKYAAGLHCPSRATLAVVEERVPGATAIYDSPIWAMLNMATPLGSQIDDGLNTLCVGVQESLYEGKLLRFGTYQRRKMGQALLSSLERQATGLDSLAAAVLLLKEACKAGDRERCFRVGQSLHKILLMTCMCEPVMRYRAPLIAYFSWFVFPLAASDCMIIDVPFAEFFETTILLREYVEILESHGVIRCEMAGPTRERCRMLAGDLGMDLQFGFMPRLKVSPGCRDSRIAGHVASQDIGKDWGLSVLRRYGYVDFPPDDILLSMRAAYHQAVRAGTACHLSSVS